jgi:hypothetical protein
MLKKTNYSLFLEIPKTLPTARLFCSLADSAIQIFEVKNIILLEMA